jgi:hypothetical protein
VDFDDDEGRKFVGRERKVYSCNFPPQLPGRFRALMVKMERGKVLRCKFKGKSLWEGEKGKVLEMEIEQKRWKVSRFDNENVKGRSWK